MNTIPMRTENALREAWRPTSDCSRWLASGTGHSPSFDPRLQHDHPSAAGAEASGQSTDTGGRRLLNRTP
eukprot:6193550-Pleurochrysis_carterae.AAC.2